MIRIFRYLWPNAGEIAALTRQILFWEDRCKQLEWRCAELEKEVKAERRRTDRLQSTFLNQLSVKNGLYGAFKEPDAEPATQPPTAPVLSIAETEELTAYAKEMREADLAQGITRPLAAYLEPMMANPSVYIDREH